MGASSALYYCSESFRALMGENVYGSSVGEDKDPFFDKKIISSLVLDSPYQNLIENIVYLVKSKKPLLPEWLIKLAIKVLNSMFFFCKIFF
jgi:isocitrate dehydrogenase kinase/phosphatase